MEREREPGNEVALQACLGVVTKLRGSCALRTLHGAYLLMIEVMEQENGVVRFDIGTFVLCHRKLCLLMQPFRKGYETFGYVTRLVKSVLVLK